MKSTKLQNYSTIYIENNNKSNFDLRKNFKEDIDVDSNLNNNTLGKIKYINIKSKYIKHIRQINLIVLFVLS